MPNAIENDDILRALTETEVEELRELYKKKFGERNFHYLLLYNQTKWTRRVQEIESNEGESETTDKWISFRKTFYTHRNCDFRKYGTYISIHFDLMQSISFFSWEPNLNELIESLRETKFINWKSGPLLTNVVLDLCQIAKEIAVLKGNTIQRARRCSGLTLSREEGLNLKFLELPIGYTLKPLQEKYAETVHEMWVNKKEGSLEYIRRLIRANNTLSIIRNADNKLIAWVFQNDFSGLGILQVLPEEQRKGFGIILASNLSKKIAQEEDVTLSAWILIENFRSQSLLEKIGYQITETHEWIQLNPFI